MTTRHTSTRSIDDVEGGAAGGGSRDAVGRLFAAALEGDCHAEAALHLLGGFDDTARRASWALLRANRDPAQPTPPDLLASIDRTLAALRDRQRSS
ncbi:hypothetical protein [Actinomycetospora lemnae]|uniref:Hpt domain-containing protein n=1 Tax=Actinomycetospora lemnae TaxID=3019891 RepID=A0ABT5T1D1_9PSEU|nr:hypothetical protein [Actinomycetospora sp. DW7H6]MDD7967743.1 hypothetical protein [Actinomycetospora sp. DW7H6]